MEDLDYKVTSEYTPLIGSPFLLVEDETFPGEFSVVSDYATTDDNHGSIHFIQGIVLTLGEDIRVVKKPGAFKFKHSLKEHPGSLIEALRDYASLKGKQYVSIDYSKQRWDLWVDDGKIIEVRPRLFVPINEATDPFDLLPEAGTGARPSLVYA
jgi:hypothetical protein